MKLFLNLACMVLASTRFSTVKADDRVCDTVGLPTIGAGACGVGDSCFCSTASIGAGACSGANACNFSDGPIGANSCLGENACRHADFSLGADSCIGENSCIGTGALIGAGSCIGLEPGDSPCGDSEGIIGAGTCNGADPCRNTGPKASIGAGTCIGPGRNCHCLDILVGALSCLGEDACIGVVEGLIGGGSCTNKGSCYRSTGDIAAGACTGEDSCYKAGGVIAAGACTGEGSCWGTKSTFSSAAGSCTGKNSCKCASKKFAAGVCLTEDSCNEECDGEIQEDTPAVNFCPCKFSETVAVPTMSPTETVVVPTMPPTEAAVVATLSPTVSTPPACPEDVAIFHTDGITTVDPGQAIQILDQDTEKVTVRLYNDWTNTEEAVDKIFYTYKHDTFSQKCHEATDTLGSVNYDEITIQCHHTMAFAELSICVADNGGVLDADGDKAEIPRCCGIFDGPTVCYKFVIYCESKCGDQEAQRRNLRIGA